MRRRHLVGCLLLAASAMAQEDDGSEARCRELAALQDAGTFTVAAAVAAMADADDSVARTATAIVRHEWAVLPAELFVALDGSPPAARRLLTELAVAPRPAAATWAGAYAQPAVGRSRDARCLALAARGTPLVAAEAELVLQTLLAGEAGDGVRAVFAVLPKKLADAMVGKLHAALAAGGVDVARLLPWIDHLSPDGVRRLLGLVVTLSEAQATVLCAHVNERAPELVQERVAAALDADSPVDPVWIAFAGPCLDCEARYVRVRNLLLDPEVPTATKDHAARALLAQKRCDPALLAHAQRDSAIGPLLVKKALDVAIDDIPAATLVQWLEGRDAVAVAAALVRRQKLEPELERALVDRLRDLGVAEGTFGTPAAMALAAHGSAEALQQIWPLLLASRSFPEFVAALGRRRAPIVHERLLTELQTPRDEVPPPVRSVQLDAVALTLVTLGDRRELARLVAAAPTAEVGVVRRCSHYASPLSAGFALQLLDNVDKARDVHVAGEMLAWAATAIADERVHARLQALWAGTASSLEQEELREVALRALAGSAGRDGLVATLRTTLAAGPLPDELEPLPYALLASMPAPPAAADLQLAADLLLLMPRTDPAREAAASARWPDGSYGFPLVGAVAERLRAADPATLADVLGAATREAVADPRRTAIAPQRLLVLWRELVVRPEVQRAVGIATAPLAAAIAPDEWPGQGPCAWFALQAALDAGDFATAAAEAGTAMRALLRLPAARRTARQFLGERDPTAGVDPWAALAAGPHLAAMRAAEARGDAAAATAAAARVREFAGHDVSTLATVSTIPPETVR